MRPDPTTHYFYVGSVAFKLLEIFANNPGMPGFTEGELAEAIRAHPHRIPKIYQRVNCDLIKHGWVIVKQKGETPSRWWMARRGPGGAYEARKYIAKLRAAHKTRQEAKIAAQIGRAA